jgi:hypothetical protein
MIPHGKYLGKWGASDLNSLLVCLSYPFFLRIWLSMLGVDNMSSGEKNS